VFAFTVFFIPLTLILNSSFVTLASGIGTALTLAFVIYALSLFLAVIGGEESTPSMVLDLVTPWWTCMRAKRGYKLRLTAYSLVFRSWLLGVKLLMAYLMQLAVTAIGPQSMDLTIPTFTPAAPLPTKMQYQISLMMAALLYVFVLWFDISGLGERDGAWMPLSLAKYNMERKQRDRHRIAVVNAFNFVMIYLQTGIPYAIIPEYVFLTWTQHVPTGGDYGLFFGWFLGTVVVSIICLMFLSFFFTDLFKALVEGLVMGGGHRSGRYGERAGEKTDEEERKKKKKSYDSTDEDEDEEDDKGGRGRESD